MNLTQPVRAARSSCDDRWLYGRSTDKKLARLSAAVLLSCLAGGALQAATFSTDFSSQPAQVQLYGDPGDGTAGAIADGVLKLTTLVGSLQASMVIDDLDTGSPVSGFTATFKLLIGGGSGADGFSFAFAGDLPDGTFGEEGAGSGIIVAFDSYDNGNGEAPAIDVKVGGTEVATRKISPRSALAANTFLPVRINLDTDGTLDVSYGDTVIYTNLYTGYVATAGRFAFGARTGGSFDNHWVDDLAITTSTAPQTQPAHPLIITTTPSGGGNSPEATVTITVKDFATQLTTSSVKLQLNGADVNPTVTKPGDTTTITYDPPGLFGSESSNTLLLTYTDSGGFTTTSLTTFTIVQYNSVTLPEPIYLETFDSAAEGGLPTGWVQTNLTDSINPGIDFDDTGSDAYLGWTVLERSRFEGAPFDARRLNVAPGYLNGALITNLVFGKSVYAESDNRGGNQIQMLFSPDFDLTGKNNVYVSYNSIYEQNQDSVAAVEYSVDQGATWNPIIIMLDEVDIVRKADGSVDAAATLTTVQTDTPQVDDGAGGTRRTAYGEFLASTPLDALGRYISGRVNDNPTESKRVELFRLPKADNQAKVRFRFVQAGTGSWYFGVDNFGLYSIASPAPPETLKNGLVAYWNFDGNLYDSISVFHGTPRGKEPVAFVDGQSGFGKALKLNGTNYVEITGGDDDGLDFPDASLSIAGWFKVDTFDKSWQALISKGEGSNYRIARRSAENTIAYAGGVGEGPNDTPNINDGNWHHFVAVTDADTTAWGTALYIDGAIYSVNTNRAELTASTRNLLIGENPEALNRQWNGLIDDLGIWNRVLTPTEVSALFNAGLGAPISTVPGLSPPSFIDLADFEFNEGRGTNTVDSVHALTGVLGIGIGRDPGNAPTIVTNSPAGTAGDRAVSLTGSSALVVNDTYGNTAPAKILAFATNAPFTIESWINIASSDTRQYEGLVAYGRSYKLGFMNQQLQFTLYGLVDINSGIFPSKGAWHHVAAVWTPGTGVEFFLDGTSVTNIAETRVPRAYQNNYLTIGAENTGTTNLVNTFLGMVDRVRIHGAALIADELDSVAATPKAALASTVVAYNLNETNWPFASSGTQPRPAVPNPSPTWTSDTPSALEGDSALSFARGTQVIVPEPTAQVQLDPANPSFTMQAWIKYQGNPAGRQVFYYNNGPGGALSFSVTNRTVFVTTLGIKDQPSNAKIPDDGGWHHIAVVHENQKEFRFYVDAVLADTQAYTGGVNFTRTNQVFYIGSEPTFGLQYTGSLDRLRVTRGMLTPDQFDYPAGGLPPALVAASALEGGVGVLFDRDVSRATATDPSNYAVSGTTVTSATLVSGNYVVLGVAATPAGPFTVTADRIASSRGDVMTGSSTVEASATAGSTIAAGLAAYWSFDGHLLDTVNGFDGAARGKVPVGFVDGVPGFGKALKLTGTNYVEIPGSSNTLRFAAGSLSIAGWFKVDSFDKSWQALIAKGENSNYRLARRDVANTIAYAGGVGEGPNDTPNINDGKWHHFVAITDAATAAWGTALYIDGTIYSVNTNKATLQAGNSNLFIGENPEALNRQYVGELDDIALWNRVLAPQEVATLYDGGQGMPLSAIPEVGSPIPAARPYSIGLNFGPNEPNGANGGTLAPSAAAGVMTQANWNNLAGQNGTNVANIVADSDYETAEPTSVTVSWVSNGTWASTGRSEENNRFTGGDRILMLGYLDTGAPTTTLVTITNIPSLLTSSGYDVYVYAMGGVGGRGGGYRILDAVSNAVLKEYVRVQSPTNSSTFIEAPIDPSSTNHAVGNFMVFEGLTAPAIIVEATTASGYGFGGTHRAPINAIQLVEVIAQPKIAWVSFHPADDTPSANAATAGFTRAPDAAYTDLLEANGYLVTRVVTSGTPDTALLNTFDLVIISRSVPSGDYQDPPETAAWNGLTAPTMVLGGYVLRNSRLGFTTGATIPDTGGPVKLTVNDPSHPIFDGVALDASKTMVNTYASPVTFNGTVQRGISVNTDPLAGGGKVLATIGTAGDPAAGGMVIGEWEAGAKMANAAGDTLGGHRLVFLTGSREADGLTSEGSGIYNLAEDGAILFLNAVEYMTSAPAAGPQLSVTSANGNVTIQWSGGGTLESAAAITGPWTPVPNATSPFTAQATGSAAFYRVRQ